jgi:hypothetical protein
MSGTKSATGRLPNEIKLDLSRELGQRVRTAMQGVIALADNDLDRIEIALGGLTIALAITAGFVSKAAGHKSNPIDVGIAILQEMRGAADGKPVGVTAMVDAVKAKSGAGY